jgi:hypothetical protein
VKAPSLLLCFFGLDAFVGILEEPGLALPSIAFEVESIANHSPFADSRQGSYPPRSVFRTSHRTIPLKHLRAFAFVRPLCSNLAPYTVRVKVSFDGLHYSGKVEDMTAYFEPEMTDTELDALPTLRQVLDEQRRAAGKPPFRASI